MYNYWRTIDTEQKALAPKAPVLVTAKQIEGYEQQWQDSLTSNAPYLIVNDTNSPTPSRINAGIMDKGATEAALMCVDEMKSTTGIFSASLGEQDNEKSGRAILAQQRKGDTANFAYIDNIKANEKFMNELLSGSPETADEIVADSEHDITTLRDRCGRSLLELAATAGKSNWVEWLVNKTSGFRLVNCRGTPLRDLFQQLGYAEFASLHDD